MAGLLPLPPYFFFAASLSNRFVQVEYAVKIIEKVPGHSRARVFKEIDTFHHCQVRYIGFCALTLDTLP